MVDRTERTAQLSGEYLEQFFAQQDTAARLYANARTLTGEITHRLEQSFAQQRSAWQAARMKRLEQSFARSAWQAARMNGLLGNSN